MKTFLTLWASPFVLAAIVGLAGCSESCQQTCDCTLRGEVGYNIIQSTGCSNAGGAFNKKLAAANNVDKFAKMCAQRCQDVDHRGKFKDTPEPPTEPDKEKWGEIINEHLKENKILAPPPPASVARESKNAMKDWEIEL